jgi:hypothetical protein
MTQWYTSGAYQFTTHDAALKQQIWRMYNSGIESA